MANRKISDLTALTAPAAGDLLPIVDISEAAAANKNKKITYSDLLNNIPTGTITSTMILDGTILNADINASAAIADTKLATIATAGKVSNSATTAASANTASGIVARDASGNFTAGTITAALTGAASANVLKAGDTMTGVLAVTAGTAALPGIAVSGDTNTGIYSPGADTIAASTGGTERARIDSSGRLLVGTSSTSGKGSLIQARNDSTGLAVEVQRSSDDGAAPAMDFTKSRGTQGSPTKVSSGDQLGVISFAGYDGAGYKDAAYIIAECDGTWTDGGDTTDNPSRLVFFTTADGAASPMERLRIDSTGNVVIGEPDVFGAGANSLALTRSTNVNTLIESTNSITSSVYGTAADGSALTWNVGAYPLVFGTSNTERARIDSSGRLLVGTSTARSNFFNGTTAAPQIQLEGLGTNTQSFLSQVRNSVDADASAHILAKSRGTALNSYTVVQSGDGLGQLSFQGADGAEFVEAASIKAEVDGTPGANDMPGRLVFSTTADGAASPTERLRISNAGAYGIGGANYGTAGQVITSNGINAEPSWQSVTVTTNANLTGDVTSVGNATAIAAEVIVNADVSASAAIAGSKIVAATTSVVGTVQLSDSTSTTSSVLAATPTAVKAAYDLANAALPKAGGTLTGNVNLDNQVDARFYEATANGTNYVGFQAPASIAADVLWTLPATDGTAAQVLSTNGSGTLSWASAASGSSISVGNTSATITDTGSDGAFTVVTEGGTRLVIDSNGFAAYTGAIGRGAPVTKTSNFTLGVAENWIITNSTSIITVTLPAASSWTGREVSFKHINAAGGLQSASSNVVPLSTSTAGTTIYSSGAGRHATLVSDGTNWIIMNAGSGS